MQPQEEFPPHRRRRIEAIRRQIASGTYETPEKLDRALEALLARLAKAPSPDLPGEPPESIWEN